MKTNAIIRIVLFSLALLILLGILASALLSIQFFYEPTELSDTVESLQVIDMEYITPDIRNIEIEWAAGSITIQKDEYVNEITITEYSPADSDYKTICKQSGQTLKIQFSEESVKFPSFGVNVDVSKDLVITVPADWPCNSLEIDAAATEVEIHDLQINELDFDGASGKFLLDNCDIVSLDIDTASGDVDFKGILKELDFDAASANFRGEFTQVPNHLYMDTMSGDLEIILPEYCGFECELDAMSGSFSSDFETETKNGIHIHGDGACKIKVSAMSGDVSILKGIE